MNHPHSLRLTLLALYLSLVTLPAWADDDCAAPVEHWQSLAAVRQMAVRQGWKIRRLKIDDGCYELRGTDTQGRNFEAKLDPETLKVVKMKQDDHPLERDRERGREPAAPSPASSPGSAPRGRIE